MQEQKDTSEKYELHKFVADKGQTPLRVDKFLVDRIENISRSKIQNAANKGYVIVNGKEVKVNYKVRPDDLIQLMTFYKPEKIDISPEDIPIDIIFEDEEYLIINKKAGMVVHPAYGNETGTLVNALMFYFKDLALFKTGELRAGLVHRLDKNTSGVMVIAKTDEALTEISRQFYERQPDKRYIAMVWGIPKEEEGTINANIGRNLKNRKVMDVFPNGDFGKHAITHYKVIMNLGHVSLVECKLETGRTHQIRVHMKYLGHPIFGDKEYGGDQILRGTRYTKYKQFIQNCFKLMPEQALHAKTLEFDHPKTGERVKYKAELPENFKLLIDKWKQYLENREI